MTLVTVTCPACGRKTAVPAQEITGQLLPFVDTLVPQHVKSYIWCERCGKEVG